MGCRTECLTGYKVATFPGFRLGPFGTFLRHFVLGPDNSNLP